MYIQDENRGREQNAPPDYSGHTYKPPERAEPAPPPPEVPSLPDAAKTVAPEEGSTDATPTDTHGESVAAGLFSSPRAQKGGKRGDLLGISGLGGLFSRIPLLSALAPPPRHPCEEKRRHSELWDWVLLAVIALSLLGGKDDDVLPLLLLLLLWD